MFKLNKITTILSICVALITIAGSIIAVDAHYAKKAEVQLIAQRLDQKIVQDRLYNIQERIWKLEDRYGSVEKMPISIKEEYRKLILDRKLIKESLEIEKKG